MGHSRPLFLYFCLNNTVNSKQKNVRCNNSLPMTRFEPRTSAPKQQTFTLPPNKKRSATLARCKIISFWQKNCQNCNLLKENVFSLLGSFPSKTFLAAASEIAINNCVDTKAGRCGETSKTGLTTSVVDVIKLFLEAIKISQKLWNWKKFVLMSEPAL